MRLAIRSPAPLPRHLQARILGAAESVLAERGVPLSDCARALARSRVPKTVGAALQQAADAGQAALNADPAHAGDALQLVLVIR